jgi:hypothetical protein
MKVKELKVEGEFLFAVTEDGKVMYCDMMEEDICWFDITPDGSNIAKPEEESKEEVKGQVK